MAFGAVADHGVGCVDGLVNRGAGEAEQGKIEQGGDDAVGGVFGQRLDCGAGDLSFIKFGCVAANDVGDLAAGALDALFMERTGNGEDGYLTGVDNLISLCERCEATLRG